MDYKQFGCVLYSGNLPTFLGDTKLIIFKIGRVMLLICCIPKHNTIPSN